MSNNEYSTSIFSLDEEKYKSLFFNAPVGILFFNASGKVQDANEYFLKLFSANRNDLINYDLFLTEDKQIESIVKAALSGKAGHYEGNYKSVFLNSVIPLKAEVSPVIVDNNIIGGIAVIEDISERKYVEKVFFHDVLNSAGNLRNLAELLDDDSLEASIKNRFYKLIQIQADKIIEEIKTQKHLLSYGVSDIKPEQKKIDLFDFLNRQIKLFNNSDLREGQLIEISDESSNISFESDPLLLGKIINNMIKNALAATKPGQQITISCKRDDDNILIGVHNPSVIPEEIQPFIFSRSLPKKIDGRGLGTYSMKYLAERYLNGVITFTSTEQTGTFFQLAIPVVFK